MKTLNDTISLGELQERFKMFGARAQSLCGRTVDGQPLGPAVKKFFDEMLLSTTDPAKIAARNEFLARAEKDPVAKMQLCGIRVDTINNYILATNNIMSMFFSVENLADTEYPVVQNTTDQEISISYVGQDGGVKMTKVEKDDDELIIKLRILTTDKVRYRRVDLYRGTIVDTALKTLHMAYDMKNQMDGLCYTLLATAAGTGAASQVTGAFGTFRYYKDGGAALKRSQYTYLPNSRINVSNLPTTNDITLSDNSATTSFRYACMLAAAKYFSQWNGAFPEGDLIPTGRILVPGADAADFGAQVQVTGNTNNPVANELLTQGWMRVNYMGKDWTVVADNTLTPGYCFFEANRKPGKVFLKPSMDRENVWGENDYNLSQNNEEERWSQKVFGAYINSATRMNVLRIRYRT